MADNRIKHFRAIFIIVNWNRKKLLDECLQSLKNFIRVPYAVVVVDNASTDDSAELVRSRHSEVYLIENTMNVGFAKANNQGVEFIEKRNLSSDFVVFLNNDVSLEDRSLLAVFDRLEKEKDVQAAIPAVFVKEGVFQTGIGGYDLSVGTAFYYFFFLSRLFPEVFRGLFLHQKYFWSRDLVCDVDWISGLSFVVKREVISRLKGWPEFFFMYAEDLAFSREIRKLGRLIYYPGAKIFHSRQGYVGKQMAFDTMWLDSLFSYYIRSRKAKHIHIKLVVLKSIFIIGFLLRMVGHAALVSRGAREESFRIKELTTYCFHVAKSLL